MSNESSSDSTDNLGHLDDAAEQAEPSSTTDGPAAEGDYDPAQGSPGHGAHPTAESFPDESAERPADS